MGTRGAYGFRMNDEDKLTYNHYDSYPSYLGVKVCEFIANNDDDRLREIANSLELVKEGDDVLDRHVNHVSKIYDVDKDKVNQYYDLLRNAQGDFECLEKGLSLMLDSNGFLANSLFCEWAYIINLDTNELEIYKGYNKCRRARGRYANIDTEDEFYGVRLIKTYKLKTIRGKKDLEKFMEYVENFGRDEDE